MAIAGERGRTSLDSSPFGREACVIGVGARFEGLLSFAGAAVIEGTQHGDVVATGRLRIAAGACVRGRIEVDELVVEGEAESEIEARDRVELCSTARVRGRIRTPRLAIADGCVVEGRCRTLPATTPRPRVEAEEADPLQPTVAAAPPA